MWKPLLLVMLAATADLVLEIVQQLYGFYLDHGVAFAKAPMLFLSVFFISSMREVHLVRKVLTGSPLANGQQPATRDLETADGRPNLAMPNYAVNFPLIVLLTILLIFGEAIEVWIDVSVFEWTELCIAITMFLLNLLLLMYLFRLAKALRAVTPLDAQDPPGRAEMYSSTKTRHTMCPICLAEFDEDSQIYVATCGHSFHPSCMQKWWQASHTCPFRCDIIVEEV